MMTASIIFGISYLVVALLAMVGIVWFFWKLNRPSSTIFGEFDDYTPANCARFEAIATVLLGLTWPALLLVLVASKIESWRIGRRFKKLRDSESFIDDDNDDDIPF